MKKFNFEGELVKEVVVPSSSTGIILRPDLVLTDNYVGMFCKNSFSNDSYILHLFSLNDLEHLQEKVVSGASDPYSNQLAWQDQHFIISGIQAGELSFNDEIMLPYSGIGEIPYIAKIEGTSVIGIGPKTYDKEDLLIYPNPVRNRVIIKSDGLGEIKLYNQAGQLVKAHTSMENILNLNVSELDSGIYFIKVFSHNQITTRKLVIE